ncbi:SET domain-containing protein SmydA-8-like [Photinus pyralis]|nr:SET domain-containing protein SmydA-8-like [Photinus pyralis]
MRLRMDDLNGCEVCQKPANQKCGGCHSIFYCGKEHQRSHWKKHKKFCRPFEMANDDNVGRFIKATKEIEEGSVIFEERPLSVSPMQLTLPVCMGCGNHVTAEDVHPCPKCGWPLCGEQCESNPNHVPECYYTSKIGQKVSITTFDTIHPLYRCVGALRCLYQKQFAPDVWRKIEKLESHCKLRKGTDGYEQDRLCVVDTIRNFLKLKEFSEEEILRCTGVIGVNAHEIPLSTPSQVGLFNVTSIFEHSCRSNAYKTFSMAGQVRVIAGRKIDKGEHISICYTEPLQTTLFRQKHLQRTKFFSCRCERCLDVTEFGTNVSALNCQSGQCKGIVLPGSFENENAEWCCKQCGSKQTAEFVMNAMKRIGDDLVLMDKGSVEDCKQFLDHYSTLLTPNHAYMIDIKLALGQLIGNGDYSLKTVSVDDLLLKKQLCQDVINIVNIIAPAEKRVIGIMLVEIYTCTTELQRRKLHKANKDPVSMLTECTTILRQAVRCLQHEPEVLFEGKLYLQALKDLKKLEGCNQLLIQNPSLLMK